MNGLDLDLVDVTSLLKPGQSRIDLRATSEEDVFFIGALVTSISTSLAGLSVDKTWQNATLPGETRVRPGDAIAFTKQGRRTDSVFGELVVPVLSKFSTFQPNTISGAFSGEIRLGYLHKNGKKIPSKSG